MVTDRNLYVDTISDVVEYYGYRRLALILDVKLDDLDGWSEGKSRPPTDVFLRIIELKRKVKT